MWNVIGCNNFCPPVPLQYVVNAPANDVRRSIEALEPTPDRWQLIVRIFAVWRVRIGVGVVSIWMMQTMMLNHPKPIVIVDERKCNDAQEPVKSLALGKA